MATAGPLAPVQLETSTFNPENKAKENFRIYNESNPRFEVVKETYRLMHVNQTHEYASTQRREWCRFNHAKMTMMEALEELNKLVDDSDPDIDLPNSFHALQTAERIREKHPDKEWFQLTGLIHDLGKVMANWGQPQWSVVGDTFVTGCKPGRSVVFVEQFKDNADMQDPVKSTPSGVYTPGCGLSNVVMSWGHDEYMYHVLKHNKSTLPDEALYMIRFHSFYPWHTGNDYDHLCDDRDRAMLPWVREFNQFDLYSKSDEVPDMATLIPYYQGLVDKYVPGVLEW